MDKVSRKVKSMMLSYPNLFPSRLMCLQRIFLSEYELYKWDDQGCVYYDCDDLPDTDKMNYDEFTNSPFAGPLSGSPLGVFFDLKKQQERLNREFVEQHIDVLCQHVDLSFREKIDLGMLNCASTTFLLAKAPWGKIDPDWLNAAHEFVNAVNEAFQSVWRVRLHQNVEQDAAKLCDHWRPVYLLFADIESKLEQQSGRRATIALRMKDLRDRLLK